MFGSMPDAPEDAVADGALDVGRGPGVAAGGQRVLGVVEHADVDVEARQRVDERGDRAVAAALDGDRDAVVDQLDDHLVDLVAVRLVAGARRARTGPTGRRGRAGTRC